MVPESQFQGTYQKFPPLQAPASYNLSEILEQMKKAAPKNPSD
jgi:arylsulfatase